MLWTLALGASCSVFGISAYDFAALHADDSRVRCTG
jgi:hypothetical protein